MVLGGPHYVKNRQQMDKRVPEWQPRNSKRSQGRHRIRWRDEIVAFAGVRWSSLTSDRERWKGLGKAFVLQWTSNS